MNKLNITLMSLGSLKYPVDISYIEKWQSDIFSIEHRYSVSQMPDSNGINWGYTDEKILEMAQPDPRSDFTVALINARLDENYYMRRITNKLVAISLYEMAEIVLSEEFTIESYILRNVYELAVLYAANSSLIPADAHTWAHDDIRGCLFDMNANKVDIRFSLHKPTLCVSCKSKILSKQVHAQLVPTVERELSRIKKHLYSRITNFIQSHPVYALIITAFSAVSLNIMASIVFEKAKKIAPWLS